MSNSCGHPRSKIAEDPKFPMTKNPNTKGRCGQSLGLIPSCLWVCDIKYIQVTIKCEWLVNSEGIVSK